MKLPDDITWHDVHQWLRGTWFEVDNRRLPVRFELVDDGRVYFRSLGDRAGYCSTDQVRLWWPRTGAVNIPDVGALYVQRTVQRQWRRSYSARELSLVVPRSEIVYRAAPDLRMRDANHPAIVRALHCPVYYGKTVAMGMLEDVPTVAVTRQVLLVRVSFSEIAVYYNNTLVGVLETNGDYVPEGDPRLVARATRALEGGAL
jgi:hypothetical protein